MTALGRRWRRALQNRQHKQGKPSQTQLPTSHESLFHHHGTLVGRQMPSTDAFLWSGLCLLWQKSSLHGARHPGRSRQILGLTISVPCQTTAGASLHSCNNQCHNTMCMPAPVYAVATWSTQGSKASSTEEVGSKSGRFLLVLNKVNINCKTVCFSYHTYCRSIKTPSYPFNLNNPIY